jgi:hypothetical protein
MATTEDLTPLQNDEREALCGDRAATIRVVSALRSYREAVAALLAARYRVDDYTMSVLADAVAVIEAAE